MARWADEAVATALSGPRRIRNVTRDVQRAGWCIGLAVALPGAAVLLATYTTGSALRFAAGAALAAGIQWLVPRAPPRAPRPRGRAPPPPGTPLPGRAG